LLVSAHFVLPPGNGAVCKSLYPASGVACAVWDDVALSVCYATPVCLLHHPQWLSCIPACVQAACRSCRHLLLLQTACFWMCMLPTRCQEWEGWVSCLWWDSGWPLQTEMTHCSCAGRHVVLAQSAVSSLRCASAQSQVQV
jgi:hypothetical protein